MRKDLLIFVFILLISFLVVNSIIIQNVTDNKTNYVSVFFVKTDNDANQIVPVKRFVGNQDAKVFIAISELLKGPNDNELKEGFYTEIPKKTRLIDVKEDSLSAKINLSEEFGIGGGSETMSLRLKQLVATAKDAAKGKNVYLEINGKRIEYIGGEGVEVPQPLSLKKN